MLTRIRDRGKADKIRELESQLAVPALPFVMRHVWNWFLELNMNERGYSGAGDALPLDARAILAWKELYGARPTRWELNIIRELDHLYLTVAAKAANERTGT